MLFPRPPAGVVCALPSASARCRPCLSPLTRCLVVRLSGPRLRREQWRLRAIHQVDPLSLKPLPPPLWSSSPQLRHIIPTPTPLLRVPPLSPHQRRSHPTSNGTMAQHPDAPPPPGRCSNPADPTPWPRALCSTHPVPSCATSTASSSQSSTSPRCRHRHGSFSPSPRYDCDL